MIVVMSVKKGRSWSFGYPNGKARVRNAGWEKKVAAVGLGSKTER